MTRPYFAALDGVDLKTHGFDVSSATGPWESGLVTLQEQAIAERDGAVLTNSIPVSSPRDVVLSGIVIGDDEDDFEAIFLDLKRFLGPRGRRDRTLVFGNLTAQQLTVRFMGISGGPTGPQMVQRKVPLDLHFRALDPYAIDTTDTTLTAAANTPLAIPLGTATCAGVTTITFSASAASVTVTYKTYAGATIGSITLTDAFVTGDVLVIDHQARTITVNGVPHVDLVTGGFFIVFDPSDGDPLLSHWPTIETNHGSVSLVYRRRWE